MNFFVFLGNDKKLFSKKYWSLLPFLPVSSSPSFSKENSFGLCEGKFVFIFNFEGWSEGLNKEKEGNFEGNEIVGYIGCVEIGE